MSDQHFDQRIESLIAREAATGDARRYRRVPVMLDARLDKHPGLKSKCVITDISAGGMFFVGPSELIENEKVTLQVDGLGEITGRIVRVTSRGYAAEFDHKRSFAAELADKLIRLINGNVLSTEKRRNTRHLTDKDVTVTLANGLEFTCHISDISKGGVFLTTTQKPPIGTKIHVEDRPGTVVRHQADGIGVAFASSKNAEL